VAEGDQVKRPIGVADSGFAPYGEREPGFVVERARAVSQYHPDPLQSAARRWLALDVPVQQLQI